MLLARPPSRRSCSSPRATASCTVAATQRGLAAGGQGSKKRRAYFASSIDESGTQLGISEGPPARGAAQQPTRTAPGHPTCCGESAASRPPSLPDPHERLFTETIRRPSIWPGGERPRSQPRCARRVSSEGLPNAAGKVREGKLASQLLCCSIRGPAGGARSSDPRARGDSLDIRFRRRGWALRNAFDRPSREPGRDRFVKDSGSRFAQRVPRRSAHKIERLPDTGSPRV